MDIPVTRWFPVIGTRRSRRTFDTSRPLSEELLSSLKKACAEFNPFPDVRVEIVTDKPERIFNLIAGSYGFITNPAAALVFIGNMDNRHIQEEAGYTGEGIILESCALGLSTCWVAGTFSPSATSQIVKTRANEKILAVSPLGFVKEQTSLTEKMLANFGRHSLRKPLKTLVSGLPESEWPAWAKTSLETAILAPSAVNRQPWRFRVETNAITVLTDNNKMDYKISKRLDCGMAMLHLEVGALNQGVKGKWELLDHSEVARFRVS